MRKITPFGIILAALFTLAILPGCSWIRGACVSAMPVIQTGQAYAADAAIAIEQAELYASRLPLSEKDKDKLVDVLEAARKAVRVGQDALATASNACNAPDILDVFADVIKTWKDIRSILASASPVGQVGAGVTVGGFPFNDPAVYRLAVARGK